MRTQNTAKNADGTSTLLKDNEPCAVRNPLVGWRLYVLEARSSSVSVVPEREQDSFDVCLVPSPRGSVVLQAACRHSVCHRETRAPHSATRVRECVRSAQCRNQHPVLDSKWQNVQLLQWVPDAGRLKGSTAYGPVYFPFLYCILSSASEARTIRGFDTAGLPKLIFCDTWRRVT